MAEELWMALGKQEHATQTPWPGVSFGYSHEHADRTEPFEAADALVRDRPACHRCDNHYPLEDTVFACPDCGKGLDVVYDYELAASHFRDFPELGAPAEHLALRGAAADRRCIGAGACGAVLRLHAADPRRPPGR
jgi:uncharacterized protein YbaR (Trm112 family)